MNLKCLYFKSLNLSIITITWREIRTLAGIRISQDNRYVYKEIDMTKQDIMPLKSKTAIQ